MPRIVRVLFTLALTAIPACAALGLVFEPLDPAATHSIPPFSIPAVQPETAYERLMVIGDMGTGSPDQQRVADVMAARAKVAGLDFILTVGDNFYPDGVRSADDPQWKTKFLDVYSDRALDVPIYASLGNHDHGGNPRAQVEFSRRNSRWIMPDQFYTFTRALTDGTSIQFFALDTDPIAQESTGAAAQLDWLDVELARSKARWKIVFGHHPVYSHGSHGATRALVDRLEPLLTKHHVHLYLSGHDHTLEMLKPVRGVNYAISGAAGGPNWAYSVDWSEDSFYAATGGGFVFVRISRDQLVIEFVRLDGQTQYAHVLTQGNEP